MIPIRDENPIHTTPYVTIGLIVVNCLVFVFEVTRSDAGMNRFIWTYGYVPAQLVNDSAEFRREMEENGPVRQVVDPFGRPVFDGRGRPVGVRQKLPIEEATAVPAWINMFTCMFLHGGWMHLLGNMLFLWIFGNNIEDKLGPVLFTVFYLGTGLAGNLAHTAAEAGVVPLVGASGAISGVMGAYILLFPHARVLTLIPAGWYWFTMRLPAWLFLGIYIVVQNFVPAFRGGQGSVAYWAHIGGFAAGAGLIYLFPRRKHPPQAARRSSGRFFDGDADFEI